jgi:ATP adenylyltransferase
MADNILWAPWRSAFVLSKKEKGCILCNRFRAKDSVANLVIYRGRTAFVILNKYPYNTGHAMVVPNRHIGSLERLTVEEANEVMALTRKTVAAMKKTLRPHSVNVGMNLGKSAGAGIPGHLHMHVVPRWNGDTNFMPVVGKTHVVSVPLEPVYKLLREELSRG